ncbi:MAG: hypothetical protein ACE5HC_16520 [Candidatus Binatia bacterium]
MGARGHTCSEEQGLIRKWMACFVVCGFVAGLGLCLIIDHNDHHHGSGVPSTLSHTAQACGTSVVPYEDQLASNCLPLVSSFDREQNTFYEGVLLSPPFPPPRG